MKKLYAVTVSGETVVLADDLAHAEDLALGSFRDLAASEFGAEACALVTLPDGWELNDVAWGDNEGLTLAERIEEGAAPGLKRLQDRLTERVQKVAP